MSSYEHYEMEENRDAMSEESFNQNFDIPNGAPSAERRAKHNTEKIVKYGPKGRYAKLNTLLGKGAYKIVYKALDREEGYEVAWNCFQHTTKAEYMEFSSEIEILKRVRHPNIITFHDCWFSNNEFIFITELMTSGTLREYIQKLQIPNLKIIKRWTRQILKGLNYLHSRDPPIIHRDIKCDNLFINGAHGEVKIGDMGTAKMRLGKKYTVIGTPEFMAPEMYEEKGYSEKVDIYALGMCLLEMVTGEYPYSECQNAAQIYRKVSQGIKPECLSKVHDPDLLNLINNCLASENERYTAQEIIDHPFLAADPEVVLLTPDSKKELTLQVVFKGTDRLSVKFEFNVETDTAEEVVREMIEEDVLPQRYQHLITFEINRILRELNKPSYYASLNQGSYHGGYRREHSELDYAKKELAMANERAVEAEKKAELSEQRARLAEEKGRSFGSTSSINENIIVPDQDPQTQKSVSSLTSSGKNILMNALKMFRGDKPPEDASNTLPRVESLPNTHISTQPLKGSHTQWFADEEQETLINKEYPDDCPIEEIVQDTVLATNRGPEKIKDWVSKLHAQDIVTVGDLRDLHEADWANLGLTVFASRALRNSLQATYSHSLPLSGSATPPQSRAPIPIASPQNNSNRSESLAGSFGRTRSISSSYEKSPTLFRQRSLGHSS